MPKDNLKVISELRTVVESNALKDVLLEHKEYLQQQVNTYVRQLDLTKAYGELCKIDDLKKIFELIDNRIKEFTKQ